VRTRRRSSAARPIAYRSSLLPRPWKDVPFAAAYSRNATRARRRHARRGRRRRRAVLRRRAREARRCAELLPAARVATSACGATKRRRSRRSLHEVPAICPRVSSDDDPMLATGQRRARHRPAEAAGARTLRIIASSRRRKASRWSSSTTPESPSSPGVDRELNPPPVTASGLRERLRWMGLSAPAYAPRQRAAPEALTKTSRKLIC